MLLEDRRIVFDKNKYTQNNLDPVADVLFGSADQSPKSTGMVDVVLGMDQDGFKELFIDLLSSLP